MAVKILSKDIYDMQNNKMRDNEIKGIDFEEDDCGFVTDYKVIVYNNKNTNNSIYQTNEDKKTNTANKEMVSRQGYSATKVSFTSGTITIPKKTQKDKIIKIYNKVDSNGDANIKYSLIGYLEEGEASYKSYNNPNRVTNPPEILFTIKDEKTFNGQIEKFSNTTIIITTASPHQELGRVSTSVSNITNLSDVKVIETKEKFIINYIVPIFSEYVSAQGVWYDNGKEKVAYDSDFGKYERIIVQELDFTIYGDLYKFNIETKKVTVAPNNEKVNHTLETNELVQKDTEVVDQIGGTMPESVGSWLSTHIANDYKDGKETAELLCQIGEYYDTSDNLAISTKDKSKSMTFNIGDIVIPYIFNAQGQNVPMSLEKDMTPKEFVVVGVEFIYDGAIWQKLTLLEKVL